MKITKSEEETHKIAHEVAERAENGGLILLTGDLGTGKTTFTKGLAQSLGIEHFTIKSPTYTYIRKHKTGGGNNFFHIDLYRIEALDELLLEEIHEIMADPTNIVAIEWADRMIDHLPKKRIEITLKYIGETSREISING